MPQNAVLFMKYLAFDRDGFPRKFPLDKPIVTIGRGDENDIVLDDELASRLHARMEVHEDHVVISDAGSRNGTFVGGVKVSEAPLRVGEFFSLAGTDFAIRDGDAAEFEAVARVELAVVARQGANQMRTVRTKDAAEIYREVLKQVRAAGIRGCQLSEIFGVLARLLPTIPGIGSVFIVAKTGQRLAWLCSYQCTPEDSRAVARIEGMTSILAEPDALRRFARKHKCVCIPIRLKEASAVLVRFPPKDQPRNSESARKFLDMLAMEIELIAAGTAPATDGAEGRADDANEEIVTRNAEMLSLCKQARRIARSDIPVLIQGESGTGKELFARLIHRTSQRSEKPFVAINCAAIPETLLESELFGCEKGAYTGADKAKRGKLELASGGTLVLDEIGDMPPQVQAKLLRVLEEHDFYRLGGSSLVKVDLRVISQTNSDLPRLVREKRFREDLYYRLAQHTLLVPPLRERREDISTLIEHFTGQYCQAECKSIGGFSRTAHDELEKYSWPGNVRQLRNEIHRLVTLADDAEVIGVELLSQAIRLGENGSEGAPSAEKIVYSPESERQRLIQLLDRNNWNKSMTARDLGITWQGLWWKMKKLAIRKETES
ncbi:MAG: sigma 54-interacting transcriptional regulator [Acidobacteria bacterium]|nr:sigma 54-interacting transcriptional regulator [Acidobacteriota bacterium]